MKFLKWKNLNPAVRQLLDRESDKWSARAISRLLLLVFLPLFVVSTVWAIVTDTDWARLWALIDKIPWLFSGLLGWALQKFQSLSGTDLLLICILLVLLRIADRNVALNETLSEWLEEWRNEHTNGGRGDYPD